MNHGATAVHERGAERLRAKFPILTLDLATTSGWACLHSPDPKARVHSGAMVLPDTSDIGRYLSAYNLWLIEMIDRHQPKFIVKEKPIQTRKRDTAVAKLWGLSAITDLRAYDAGIRCLQADPRTIKAHWTGNGNASKQDMIDVCIAKGINPADDNEADAVALLSLTLSQLAPDVSGQRFYRMQPEEPKVVSGDNAIGYTE